MKEVFRKNDCCGKTTDIESDNTLPKDFQKAEYT